MSPQARREAVDAMRAKTRVSERRACALIGLSRTVLHYAGRVSEKNAIVRSRMLAIAAERRRFGYRRIHVLLRREGQCVNVKRVYRLYRLERLQVQRRRKRRGVALERRPLTIPERPNQVWSIDFVSDSLESGRRLKCLTIVDDFTKEAVDIVVDHGISGRYVTRVTNRATALKPGGTSLPRRRPGVGSQCIRDSQTACEGHRAKHPAVDFKDFAPKHPRLPAN